MDPSFPASVSPGSILGGKYRIDRVLGRGGMAVVLAASQPRGDVLGAAGSRTARRAGSLAARLVLASSPGSARGAQGISEARPRGPTESAVTLAGQAVPLRHPDHLLVDSAQS